IGSLLSSLHPKKRVADMLRIGRTTQAHVSSLDSAISREAFGFNAPRFGRMQGPSLEALFEIGILYVSQKERIMGKHLLFALDTIMPIKFADNAHGFLVRHIRGPPIEAFYARHQRMTSVDIPFLVHPYELIN